MHLRGIDYSHTFLGASRTKSSRSALDSQVISDDVFDNIKSISVLPCMPSSSRSPESMSDSSAALAYAICCSANESGRTARLRHRPVNISSTQKSQPPGTDEILRPRQRTWEQWTCVDRCWSDLGGEHTPNGADGV